MPNEPKPIEHCHPKKRGGREMDLVYIFYAFIGALAFLMSLQAIAYDTFVFKNASIWYWIVDIVFGKDAFSSAIAPVFQGIPIDVLVSILGAYTFIYGGAQTGITFMSSAKMPQGESVAMPEYKLKRFFGMMIAWAIFAGYITILEFRIKPDDYKLGVFYGLTNIYYGMGASVLIYISSRQVHKVAEHLGPKSADTPPPEGH